MPITTLNPVSNSTSDSERPPLKTALVHDYLAQAGGAERVVSVLHGMFPEAPLYTSVYDREETFAEFQEMEIRTSALQRWPFSSRRYHKFALPLYPQAFEQMDFSGFDLVVSSSSSFAKGIITPPETCHICYCHTPSRFIWRQEDYLKQAGSSPLTSLALGPLLSRLRSWDVESAQRVDYFVANSYNVARRIRKYYRREVAAVIHPPVETQKFAPAPSSEVGEHFLVVSRLLNYKRIDLAVQACNQLKVPLRIVGDGPDLAALKSAAGSTIQFLGRLSDKEVARELSVCRALIFPGEEDFGITPVECMASGRPVVAYGAGGALETVVEGETGLFFPKQTADSLASVLAALPDRLFSPEALQKYAAGFDTSVFVAQMHTLIDEAQAEYCRGNSVQRINDRSLSGSRPR